MFKQNLSKITQDIQKTMTEYKPEILMFIGVSGFITTIGLAIEATPKAFTILENEKKAREYDREVNGIPEKIVPRNISKVDAVKMTWKYYVPTVVSAGISIACVVSAHSEHVKRHNALAAAYSLSEMALKDYQSKVIETIGEKKEQLIKDKVAKERIDRDPVTDKQVIFTGDGDSLFYEVTSKRYFYSDIETIRKAENILNRRLMDDMWISLNEFYWEIGLDGTSIGDDIGWDVDAGLIEFDFSTQLTEKGKPCIVIDFSAAPKYRYR